MKQLSILLVINCLIIGSSIAQPKIQFGVITEGSLFMPALTYESTRDLIKDGFGAGIGVFASRNVFWRISADVGLLYRYSQMKNHFWVPVEGSNFGNYYGYGGFAGYGYSNNGLKEGWEQLPMHSLVVPVHLRLHFTKNLFVSGGIESVWLLNYKAVNEKPEFNWTLGFGSDKNKLRWSVNYIKGFTDQGFGNRIPEADGHYKGSVYRNNMLQLSLSYPIWQKK
jgi:hypothetical protein